MSDTSSTSDTLSNAQLTALFDFKAAFPNMSWNIGVDNVLRMETWLTGGEVQFLREATQMMAPVREGDDLAHDRQQPWHPASRGWVG